MKGYLQILFECLLIITWVVNFMIGVDINLPSVFSKIRLGFSWIHCLIPYSKQMILIDETVVTLRCGLFHYRYRWLVLLEVPDVLQIRAA